MKGNPKVIAELNKALREELTAINQYFLHAEMCENWGYHKLSEFIKKQSIGEMKHAEVLIERILFLDGSPSMQPLELTVGGTVKGMIESDLALELGAVKQYNDAVALATKEGRQRIARSVCPLLKDEEEHVDFLEAQMHLIKEARLRAVPDACRWVRTKNSVARALLPAPKLFSQQIRVR